MLRLVGTLEGGEEKRVKRESNDDGGGQRAEGAGAPGP